MLYYKAMKKYALIVVAALLVVPALSARAAAPPGYEIYATYSCSPDGANCTGTPHLQAMGTYYFSCSDASITKVEDVDNGYAVDPVSLVSSNFYSFESSAGEASQILLMNAGGYVACGNGTSLEIYTEKVETQTTQNMFQVATSTASSLTAMVSSFLSDPGLLLVVVLAAGIPLGFYVIHQLIGLVPKSRGRK